MRRLQHPAICSVVFSSLNFSFQMLLASHRRLLFNLCRKALFNSAVLPRSIVPVRHMNLNERMKRQILMRINTVLNDNDPTDTPPESDADAATVTCLTNELILSARMVRFPFNYRCILEQQLAICPDRWVSGDEWRELYEMIGEGAKPVFASITMLVCVQLKHVERGRSLLDYVERHHLDLLSSTPMTYAAYMHILAGDFFAVAGKKHAHDYSTHAKELCRVYETFVKQRKQVNSLTSDHFRDVRWHPTSRSVFSRLLPRKQP